MGVESSILRSDLVLELIVILCAPPGYRLSFVCDMSWLALSTKDGRLGPLFSIGRLALPGGVVCLLLFRVTIWNSPWGGAGYLTSIGLLLRRCSVWVSKAIRFARILSR
jgi:hypothetical protein